MRYNILLVDTVHTRLYTTCSLFNFYRTKHPGRYGVSTGHCGVATGHIGVSIEHFDVSSTSTWVHSSRADARSQQWATLHFALGPLSEVLEAIPETGYR